MIVILASAAQRDLRAIGRYIAQDNPLRAVSFIAELESAAQGLAEMPQGFPLVPRYERYGIRRRSYRGYALLYRVAGDRIGVVQILGPGQDIDRALNLL